VSVRNQRIAFFAAIAAMWAFFFIQAVHTPTLLDDWYQLTWHRHHAFGASSIWEYGHYNYFHFNPRIGDVLLLIMNGPRWIHLVCTPLVQLALVPLAFIVAFARVPKPTLRDLQLLIVLQLAIWLIMPIPGIVYFYRPFATNYLWSFATMLALFAPYRLALASDDPKPRAWLAPIMLVLGWVAGMGNEHTGPTAMLAMVVLLVLAYKRGKLRLWMIAGALGLFIGYPMLFLAPGQTQRYAGVATKSSPLKVLLERGLSGNGQIVLDFLAEAQFAIELVVLGVLVAVRRPQLGAFAKAHYVAVVGLIVGAGGMVCTQFASPTVGERLFLAPAVLFAAALVVVVAWLFEDARVRRGVMIVVGLLFAYHLVRFVDVLGDGYRENQARMELLAKAPNDTVVQVPPFGLWKRSRWWWGDDFQYASLREYVANEVYDLRGIEYDRPLHWAEPSPPDRFVATRTFVPSLTPKEEAQVTPRYIPTYWEWALVQLRRSLVLGPIGTLPGHALARYTVDVADAGLDDPKRRAVRVFDWTPTKLTFADGRQYDDPAGRPWVRVWKASVPAGTEDAFIVGCGTTTRVIAEEDTLEQIGPKLPIALACRGTFTAYLCDPKVCWLAGRYWR
jgi:hypothetical protein